jgi:hypothetical protein
VTPAEAAEITRCLETIEATIQKVVDTIGANTAYRLIAPSFTRLASAARKPKHRPKKQPSEAEAILAVLVNGSFREQSARSLSKELYQEKGLTEATAYERVKKLRQHQQRDPNWTEWQFFNSLCRHLASDFKKRLLTTIDEQEIVAMFSDEEWAQMLELALPPTVKKVG